MQVPSDLTIEGRIASAQAGEQTNPGELGREAFLDLLVSQLANQDPLSPVQDHEFVAQLATFSSLEQLEGINEGMQASLLMNQSVNNTLATNLIGKEVLAIGDTMSLKESEGASFQLELGAEAEVAVLVRDGAGNLVRRIDSGDTKAGTTTIEWDGKTDAGTRAAAGTYTFEVVATDDAGLPVPYNSKVRARVDGVRFVDGAGYLMVGDTSIALANVIEILAAQDS